MIVPKADRKKNSAYNQVYQFKITLQGITPLIWRCIQVPENYTFWDFHVAIQDAMGWKDCSSHMFNLINPRTAEYVRIEIPSRDSDEDSGNDGSPDWEEYIADYFTPTNIEAEYGYDFRNSWIHGIEFEGVYHRVPELRYPVCIAGESACPPEDCGGIPGYLELVEAMKSSAHPSHKKLIDRLGYRYNPDDFRPENVVFDDPGKRLKILQMNNGHLY